MFPYVPINQLLLSIAIAVVRANELENCQSGPITRATPRLANLNDNPASRRRRDLIPQDVARIHPRLPRNPLFHPLVRHVVVGIPMSADPVGSVFRNTMPVYLALRGRRGRASLLTRDNKRRKERKKEREKREDKKTAK